MKRLIFIFLIGFVKALAATDSTVALPAGTVPVDPSSAVSLNLVVRGMDTVSATVNGVSVGTIKPPYPISFTSVPIGLNVISLATCNYRGVTSTINLTIATTISGGGGGGSIIVMRAKIYR